MTPEQHVARIERAIERLEALLATIEELCKTSSATSPLERSASGAPPSSTSATSTTVDRIYKQANAAVVSPFEGEL